MTTSWDGDDYARRLDEQLRAVEAAGGTRHGEADLVTSLAPTSVLDAGCGTGRVAVELARRGFEVVGVDVDASMLATARRTDAAVEWIEADLVGLDLRRTFDAVVMAGNVPLFTPVGTSDALVTACASHVASGGTMVAGFQLDGRYSTDAYDEACAAAGLALVTRWATWDGEPFVIAESDYAVSVHRRGGP